MLVAAGVTAAPAQAQSPMIYSLSVPVELEHDSNPLMAPGGSPGTTFLRATPTFTGALVRGNDRFEVEAGLTAEKSSNTSVAQDRVDPRLRASWKHEDPINTVELAALVDRSALRDLDLREQIPLGVDGSRTMAAVTGKWQRDLDERTSFSGEARQEWVRFSGSPEPDYRRTSAAARLTRQQSEVQSWYGAINGQVYRADSLPGLVGTGSTRSHAIGALVGINHAFSDAWRVDVGAGPVRFGNGSSRTTWQGAVKAEYTGERWSAVLEAARTPAVNSLFGGLVSAEELRARVRFDMGNETRLEFDAGHARERALRNERSLASVAWVRQLTAAWQLALKGSVHRQDGPAGTARSNRLAVLLVYNTPDL